MRWQQLFADLQAQFDEEEAAAEQARVRLAGARRGGGAVRWPTGCAGALGSPLVLGCRGAGTVAGVLVEVGADWLLRRGRARHGRPSSRWRRSGRSAGLGRRTAAPEPVGAVRGRLDLRRALRGLARDRSAVQVVLDDGGVLSGTLDRVGADYVELAEHPADLPRRSEAVQGVRAVVIDAVAVVRTVTPGLG